MIKYIFLLFSSLFICSLYSQEYFESNTIVKQRISYEDFELTDPGRNMFQLIGLENNIDARKLFLDAKYRLLIRVARNQSNRLIVNINTTRVSLDGNINIRDFAIDTLLWPAKFTATLSIKNGRHIRDELKVSGPVFGSLLEVDITDFISSNIGEFSVVLSDVKFQYNQINLNILEEHTESIKYYYSFGLMVKDLIVEYNNYVVKNDQRAYNLFIEKVELDRVSDYIASHSFTYKLHLRNRDPIGLLKHLKKFDRLNKRAETLFNEKILENKLDTSYPLLFCNGYCDLSIKYLNAGNSLQPSDASGFEEVARIDINQQAKNDLKLVIDYYNRWSNYHANDITQCIFNGFVNLSNSFIAEENYSDALLLLYNSKIIANWFNIDLTSDFNSSVVTSLDGIASSYLKVGSMALAANNLEFAEQYIKKADNVLNENILLLENIVFTDTSFNEYIGIQTDIAITYLASHDHNKAFLSLSSAEKICQKKNESSLCKRVDSIACEAAIDFIKFDLGQLDRLISNFQYPDAFDKLIDIHNYILKNSCFNEYDNTKFEVLAYSLFLEFLQQGEILIDAKQSRMALENLLKAQKIQELIKGDLIDVKRLIELAAEHEIIKVIDQAKYETWGNRMEEARSLYDEAIILNNHYFQNDNQHIAKAIEELKNQMELRKCLDFKNGYSDAIKKANLLIRANDYSGLVDILIEADNYVKNYPECEIDNRELTKIRIDYQSVLQYFLLYDEIRTKLFEKGYQEVIHLYIELMNFYKLHELSVYDINFHSLKDFIIKQDLPNLTLETVRYYIENDKPEKSLIYSKIYEEQGGYYSLFKPMITSLAKQLAKQDDENGITVSDALNKYTDGVGWFNTFRVHYLKNRVIK